MDYYKSNLNDIEEISRQDLEKMDFYETALYIQTLNQVEENYDKLEGVNNE